MLNDIAKDYDDDADVDNDKLSMSTLCPFSYIYIHTYHSVVFWEANWEEYWNASNYFRMSSLEIILEKWEEWQQGQTVYF